MVMIIVSGRGLAISMSRSQEASYLCWRELPYRHNLTHPCHFYKEQGAMRYSISYEIA